MLVSAVGLTRLKSPEIEFLVFISSQGRESIDLKAKTIQFCFDLFRSDENENRG